MPKFRRIQLYYEKVNKIVNIDDSSNLLFDIGHVLEPIISNISKKNNVQ